MGFQQVPVTWADETDMRRRLAMAINQLSDGRSNAKASVTLTANQATTVVADRRVGIDSVISFMPKTANAAAELGAGGMYISARGDGTFTITHANNAQADRDFEYAIQG